MDLFSQPPHSSSEKTNLPELSVSELSAALKRTVEDRFSYVRLRGEVSQPKRAASGHIYLRLKDEKAVLDGICWRGAAQKLSIQPEEGMDVIVTGRLTTYPGRSSYQIIIETLELAGEGALLKLLEERRKKLASEGLFDLNRKKPLPFTPQTIGIITSPTGAVIRDMMHRLRERFPTPVLLWGVNVQGDLAANQITAAIQGFNNMTPENAPSLRKPDLLIVARGGGSLEDLMAFNEENVVRAAAASQIPLISAVGHETDTTLIDYAADKRAPTPTAAAEIAVPVRRELWIQVQEQAHRFRQGIWRKHQECATKLESYTRGLGHPDRLLETHTQRLDLAASKLQSALNSHVERSRSTLLRIGGTLPHPKSIISLKAAHLSSSAKALTVAFRNTTTQQSQKIIQFSERLSMLQERATYSLENLLQRQRTTLLQQGQLLESYSYRNVLKRGFSLVTDKNGAAITSAAAIAPQELVQIHFGDETSATAEILENSETSAKAKPRQQNTLEKEPPKSKPTDQGSLF